MAGIWAAEFSRGAGIIAICYRPSDHLRRNRAHQNDFLRRLMA
jgi:hypothetical protein